MLIEFLLRKERETKLLEACKGKLGLHANYVSEGSLSHSTPVTTRARTFPYASHRKESRKSILIGHSFLALFLCIIYTKEKQPLPPTVGFRNYESFIAPISHL